MVRDTSRDGFRNKVESSMLTHFAGLWNIVQSNDFLKRRVNKFVTNNAIYKVPTRPYAFSLMAPYTSWDSLIDRTYTGRHLPADPAFNQGDLPHVEELAVLFKKTGETKYSDKSTLLFPYFVQWFTDGFLPNIFNPQTFSPLGWEILQTTHSLCDLVNRNVPQDKPLNVTFYRQPASTGR